MNMLLVIMLDLAPWPPTSFAQKQLSLPYTLSVTVPQKITVEDTGFRTNCREMGQTHPRLGVILLYDIASQQQN